MANFDHNILYPPRRNSQIQPELGNGSTFTISMTEMSAAVIHVRHSDLSSNFYDIDMSQGESDVDYKE
ncbi:hypothetical protein G9A89_009864 [Geosiphon pyriformis]|nr:hypothetical protein G9A89_009864 [Geosiphon pyriformis]